jgi:hypothetical protein
MHVQKCVDLQKQIQIKQNGKKKAKKLKTLVHALPFQSLYNNDILLDVCSFINTML